jgi:hypothetical protein
MSDEMGTIEVTISHMAGSVAQEAATPIIEIDGQPRNGVWGVNTLSVPPGTHTLTAHHRWLVFPKAYKSSTTVDVVAGQVLRLEWKTGAAAFSAGKWTVLSGGGAG